MKKTLLAIALLLAILFSVMAGTKMVNLAGANPETLTNASISIQSPEDREYFDTESILLNFTVATNNAEWVEQFSFFYVLDGQDYRYSSVEVEDIQKSTSDGKYYYEGQANLSNLSDGSHSLIVFIGSPESNGVSIGIGTEAKVNFTIEPEPFPTTLVATASGISLAVVGLGLLVYFKKRKH